MCSWAGNEPRGDARRRRARDVYTEVSFNPDTKKPAPGDSRDGRVSKLETSSGAGGAQVVSLEVMSMDVGVVGTANVLPLAALKSSVLRFTE